MQFGAAAANVCAATGRVCRVSLKTCTGQFDEPAPRFALNAVPEVQPAAAAR